MCTIFLEFVFLHSDQLWRCLWLRTVLLECSRRIPLFFLSFLFSFFFFFLFKFFSGGLKYLKKNCVFQILLKFQYSLILMYFDTNFEYQFWIFHISYSNSWVSMNIKIGIWMPGSIQLSFSQLQNKCPDAEGWLFFQNPKNYFLH
jgi:hypothetical protein